jgi:hypothetical protein
MHRCAAVSHRWQTVGQSASVSNHCAPFAAHANLTETLQHMCHSRLSRCVRSLDVEDMPAPFVGEQLMQLVAAAMPHLKQLHVKLPHAERLPPFASFQLAKLQRVFLHFHSWAPIASINDSIATLSHLHTLQEMVLVKFDTASAAMFAGVSFAPLRQLPALTTLVLFSPLFESLLHNAEALQLASIAQLQNPHFPCSFQALQIILETAAQAAKPLQWRRWPSVFGVNNKIAASMPAAVSHLTEIDLYAASVSAASLACLAQLPLLTHMTLRGQRWRFTLPPSFRRWPSGARSRLHVPFAFEPAWGNALITKLPDALPAVKTVHLKEISISTEELQALVQRLPNLTDLRMRNAYGIISGQEVTMMNGGSLVIRYFND